MNKIKTIRHQFSSIFIFTALFLLQLGLTQSIGQRYTMDNYTDTIRYHKGLISLYKNSDRIRVSGYLQPQFQVASAKGAASYIGGDFQDAVNNRFSLRRGRLRIDYAHENKDGLPSIQFVLQFDGTERGVFARDFFGRIYENKWSLFNFSMGIFPRPFGHEVNLSSQERESPERGRMSQILMKTERDIGAMVSFEPQKKDHPLKFLKVDLGVFNGQGLTSELNDFDSYKDVIGRVSVNEIKMKKNLSISAGASILYGGMQQFTSTIYTMKNGGFSVSNSTSNIGKIAPRHYFGADVQIIIPNSKGQTELRAEYIAGKQTGTAHVTDTPGKIPLQNGAPEPLYIRPFNGAYFYLLQDLFSPKHQLGIKYDWYDPNTKRSGKAIDGQNTAADIAYNTLGLGYNYYINDNLRLLVWYDIVKNEKTSLGIYQKDLKDNVFTTRLQFRF